MPNPRPLWTWAGLLVSSCAMQVAGPTYEDDKLIGGSPLAEHSEVIRINSSGASCTAARVSERHILTAAHCMVDLNTGVQNRFFAGDELRVTNDPEHDTARDNYPFTYEISQTWIAPGVQAACQGGFRQPDLAYVDMAVIEVTIALDESIATAPIDTGAVSSGETVLKVGYGCEQSVQVPGGPIARKKGATTQVQNVPTSSYSAWSIPSETFFYDNLIATPGMSTQASASLCPGDSGGPLLRGAAVVGVNSYYYFGGSQPSGVSLHDLHTSASGKAEWLRGILPSESFVGAAPSPTPPTVGGSTTPGVGASCSGATSGMCIDIVTMSCPVATLSGACPGPANVRCCPM